MFFEVLCCLCVLLAESERKGGNLFIAAVFVGCIALWGNVAFCAYIFCLVPLLHLDHDNQKVPRIPLPKIHFTPDVLWVIVLTALSLFTRCTNLSHPHHILFDEVHFGKFVNNHITGKWYYDIHPPWVKLLMAWFLVTYTGYDGLQTFDEIGQKFEANSPVKAFRFIPSVAAALLVPVTYLTARNLKISVWGSLLSAMMFLLDNLIVTEGRMLTTDTSLLFFISLSFCTHVWANNQVLFSSQWYLATALCGLFMGMTISTKWTGLSVIGVVGISTVCDLYHRGHIPPFDFHVKDFFVRLLLLLGIPVAFYVTMFWLWFYTCPRKGEHGHMSPAFLANLIGGTNKNNLPPPSFWENFVQLNTAMFVGNKNILTPHHWQSYWYTWPLDQRGLNCWYSEYYPDSSRGNKEAVQQHVYFLGNPFVWWFAFACLLVGFFVLFQSSVSSSVETANTGVGNEALGTASHKFRAFQLYLGYVSSILPYVLVRRSCFIYHYMPSLFFALLLTGMVCDKLLFQRISTTRPRVYFLLGLIGLFWWSFWFFGVFTYGLPISVDEFEARIWIDPGWR